MVTMVSFTPISQYKPGDLSKIIRESYSQLVENDPRYWKHEEVNWDYFDKQAFAVSEIGMCLFVTCLDEQPVGLAAWDPRNFPEYGTIGQNCILPEFRGKGLGTIQIQEVLRIFRENNARKAKVTTSEHPFFETAQKMYKSLGFNEVKRYVGGPDPNFLIVEFERPL